LSEENHIGGAGSGKLDRIASPLTSTAVAAPRSRASAARLIVVLGSVNAIGPLSIDMYLPAFPDIARELHTTATEVQLTLTACVAGLALGQLVVGPLSDRVGRRVPLVAAMATYAVASLLCASAANVGMLIGLRFVQGLAGAGGIVIARAVVRDLHTGAAAVRLFSSLMLVTGLAPILAPLVGGQLLALTSWQGIFVTLAVLSALIAGLAALALPETLPPERRSTHGLARTVRTMTALLRHRSFLGHALAAALTFGALFAYISGSSFVLQRIYGLSPQAYSLAFAMNGLGLIAASQVNARIVERVGPTRLLQRALACVVTSALVLLVVVSVGGLPLGALLVPMFAIVSSLAFVMPNATALALADHPEVAGTASALLGVIQFLVGAIAAPLVGVAGPDSAVPMGVVMVVLAVGALFAQRAAGRRRPWRLAR
jgi:DHA1 family bicyclomycin/chloramphenicol resistance-like MFS transporter